MEDLKNLIEKNKRMFFIVLAAAMFVFIAFLPAVDVMGKGTINGFKLIAEGEGLGFIRFVTLLMVIVPVIIIVNQFVTLKLNDNLKAKLEFLCFSLAIILFILFAVSLPQGLSATTGAYLYLICSILGAAGCYLVKGGK